MAENRVRDYLNTTTSSGTVAVATAAAFVPCLVPVTMPAAQFSFVAEVYRLARELAERQLRQQARTFPPAFSVN